MMTTVGFIRAMVSSLIISERGVGGECHSEHQEGKEKWVRWEEGLTVGGREEGNVDGDDVRLSAELLQRHILHAHGPDQTQDNKSTQTWNENISPLKFFFSPPESSMMKLDADEMGSAHLSSSEGNESCPRSLEGPKPFKISAAIFPMLPVPMIPITLPRMSNPSRPEMEKLCSLQKRSALERHTLCGE